MGGINEIFKKKKINKKLRIKVKVRVVVLDQVFAKYKLNNKNLMRYNGNVYLRPCICTASNIVFCM